jgi:hypothetical protein
MYNPAEVVRGLVIAVALAVGLIVAPAHAGVASHNPVAITDPAGDSTGAPDITRVTVANSNRGEILFVVQTSNRNELTANDEVQIVVDSDQNAATGERNGDGGDDFVIWIDGTQRTVGIQRWNGSAWESAPNTTLEGAYNGGYVVIINRSELGNTARFDYYVNTFLQNDTNQFDSAPNDVYQEYVLGPPHVESITPRWAPAAPRAGATFRLNAVQIKFETEETAAAASYTCRATLAGKRLRGTGRGGCTFRLPKTAKGKRLVIVVTATPPGGQAASRSVTFRVR